MSSSGKSASPLPGESAPRYHLPTAGHLITSNSWGRWRSKNLRPNQRARPLQITHFRPPRGFKPRHETSLPHRPDHRLRESLRLAAAAKVGGAACRIEHGGIGCGLDTRGCVDEFTQLMALAKPAQQHGGRKHESGRVRGAVSRDVWCRTMARIGGGTAFAHVQGLGEAEAPRSGDPSRDQS